MRRDSVPELVAGRYRVVRELGRGGFAAVFEAVDEATGRRVALKLLDRKALELAGGLHRFHREATVLRHLAHPNIVRAHDAGEHEGTPYLVLELLHGVTVEAALTRGGALTLPRVVSIARSLLGALAEAHRAGVVHRDVKPANVFLCEVDGLTTVKLLDFGLAKADGLDVARTALGATLGTAAYMAPEQITGAPVGPAADIYAVGLLMAELLTGAPVYSGGSGLSILVIKASGRPVDLPGALLTSPVAQVITRAVAVDPGQRFPDADAMRAAIDAAVGTELPRISVGPSPGADPLGATAMVGGARPGGEDMESETWRPHELVGRQVAAGGTTGATLRVDAAMVGPAQGPDATARAGDTIAAVSVQRMSVRGEAPAEDALAAEGPIASASVAAGAPVAPAPVAATPSPPTRRRAAAIVGAVVAVVIGGGTLWALRDREPDPHITLKEPRGVLVIEDEGYQARFAASDLAKHPVRSCPLLAGLRVDEITGRLAPFAPVQLQNRGAIVAYWLARYEGMSVPIALFRVEGGAHRGRSAAETVAVLAERLSVAGPVLTGGTRVVSLPPSMPVEVGERALCK